MAEAILGVICLALLAFHAFQAKAWAAERRHLVNMVATDSAAEFVAVQRASSPTAAEWMAARKRKAPEGYTERPAPFGL